ncbi:MAG: DUF3106 domain-containing protein [Phycisphaerae bacterium]|nr:DUF3106 domain-containing protein [Phycisphaerae bacterium]
MMTSKLTQDDYEALTAWMDGELDDAQAETVARKLQSDPAWTEAHEQLLETDSLLDAWDAPAPADRDALVASILGRARPRSTVVRIARWMAPLSAAAAAIILAILVIHGYSTPAGPSPVPDEFVAGGLDVFTEMPIADSESRRGGSIVDPLKPSRAKWDALDPAQRGRARQKALAFLKMTPEQQSQALAKYQENQDAATATQGQAYWLKVVVESFSPDQRRELLNMTPAQRAKTFLERRKQLIREGKLAPGK